MSVAFANKVIAGLRSYGVKVHLLSGWERRGNGQTSAYIGGIMHHTATSYGICLPGTGIANLLRDGRPDLSGPLCNSAGNSDGSVTIVAAHPANHAGASGGRSMGPLPVTSLFNKRVWGHEIVYPGNKPMTAAQRRTMLILGKVLTDILGRPNSNWIRGHAETSITGKWDPGYAPGKTIDLTKVRRDINAVNDPTEDLKTDERRWLRELHELYRKGNATEGHPQTAGEMTLVIIEMLKRGRTLEAVIDGLAQTLSNGGVTKQDIKNSVVEALKDISKDVDVNE